MADSFAPETDEITRGGTQTTLQGDMSTPEPAPNLSPRWGPTTKLIFGLAIMAGIATLLVQYRKFIGPLILMFILAYLLHPLADRLTRLTHLSWRASVNLIYLVLIILLLGLFAVAGLAIVQQVTSLIGIISGFVNNLPQLMTELSSKNYSIGPFKINLAQYDLPLLANQLLGVVQPILGRVGALVSSFAASAATTLGWVFFVVITSYFLLAESSQVSPQMFRIELPGYEHDLRRLSAELKDIWNAFLRGQFVIFILVVVVYSMLMGILGMRYAVGIGLMAGLARFVPYFGPFVTWTVAALVALLQGSNYFGLEPWKYAILVVGLCLLLDQIFDNVVMPRLMGQTLGVHPAAVLVAALILTSLMGLIGLVLTAPVLATLVLLGRYVIRKMFDLDPWPVAYKEAKPIQFPFARLFGRLRAWARSQRRSRP